jgi:hypothetical protein
MSLLKRSVIEFNSILVYSVVVSVSLSLSACSYEPHGRWEATKKVEVLKERGHLTSTVFFVEIGEVCALSEKWHLQKEMRYKEVVCPKGKGWITDEENFKKLSD